MYQQNFLIIFANDSKQNPLFGTARICILSIRRICNHCGIFFSFFFLGGEIIIVEIELYLFSNISFKRIVRCKTEAGLIPGTRILKYLKELVVVLNAWTKD